MAQISLNNGNSYMTASEAIRTIYDPDSSYCGGWDAIVYAMDDDIRESIVNAGLDYNGDEQHDNELFLAAYLEAAEHDLVIG